MNQNYTKNNKTIAIINLIFNILVSLTSITLFIYQYLTNKLYWIINNESQSYKKGLINDLTTQINYVNQKYKQHYVYLQTQNILILMGILFSLIAIIFIIGLIKKGGDINSNYLKLSAKTLKIMAYIFVGLNGLINIVCQGYLLSFYLDFMHITCRNDCINIKDYQISYFILIIIGGIMVLFSLFNYILVQMYRIKKRIENYKTLQMQTILDTHIQNEIKSNKFEQNLYEQKYQKNKLRDYGTNQQNITAEIIKKDNQLQFQLKKNQHNQQPSYLKKLGTQPISQKYPQSNLKSIQTQSNFNFISHSKNNNNNIEQPTYNQTNKKIKQQTQNSSIQQNSIMEVIPKNRTYLGQSKIETNSPQKTKTYSKLQKGLNFESNDISNINDWMKQDKGWNKQRQQIMQDYEKSKKKGFIQNQYDENENNQDFKSEVSKNYSILSRKSKMPELQKTRMQQRKFR